MKRFLDDVLAAFVYFPISMLLVVLLVFAVLWTIFTAFFVVLKLLFIILCFYTVGVVIWMVRN